MSDKTENYNKIPWRDGDWINVTQEGRKYQFLEDSLLGDGGYRNGKYLVPHKREDKNSLDIRKSKAYYSNQYRPIWQAHHKPIFKSKAIRTIDESLPSVAVDLYNVFLNNADGKGVALQQFSQDNAGVTKNKGASFMVMNNEADIDGTIQDVLDTRKGVPYVFKVNPDMVFDYKTDSFGNLIELRWTQQDGDITYNNVGMPKDVTSGLNGTESTIVVGVNAEYWTTYNQDGSEVVSQVENVIGEIPVARLVEEDNDCMIPESSLYSVARIQHRVYNLASIITDIEDNQAFSILTMPQKGTGIDFSTTKGLSYDQESSNKPEFISPDAQQLKTLGEMLNGLIHEMYQAGVVSHLQRFQQSAESKEIDRSRLNDLLGTFKNQIESAERRLMYLFGLYTNYDYKYNVSYSDDFGISTLSEQIDQFVILANTGVLTSGFVDELEDRLIDQVLDFTDEDLKAGFLEKIQAQREVKQNEATIENQFLVEE